MTITTHEGGTVLDPSDIDEVIYRVAFAAFTYYPTKPVDEEGYTLDEDIQWCLQPVAGKAGVDAAALAPSIRLAITDPTAHRQALIRILESHIG